MTGGTPIDPDSAPEPHYVSAESDAPVVDEGDDDEADNRWDPDSGEKIGDRLARIVGSSMGYSPDDLPRELPLLDLGLDSLMAVRIKNRVEHEFSIPPLELQAMRDASLNDVVDMVTFAVENPDKVGELAAQQAGGQVTAVPGGDVVRLSADDIGVAGDVFKVDWRTVNFPGLALAYSTTSSMESNSLSLPTMSTAGSAPQLAIGCRFSML